MATFLSEEKTKHIEEEQTASKITTHKTSFVSMIMSAVIFIVVTYFIIAILW